MRLAKSSLIALLLALAVLFLAMGLEVPIPHLPWRGVSARDIPIGILLVFAGMAVARFWTIAQNEDKLMDDWQRRRKRPR